MTDLLIDKHGVGGSSGGDFDGELDHLRRWLIDVAPEVPLMEAVHRAVLEFNRLQAGGERSHRRRLALILGVPTLLANSTLRFVQWREVIAEFAAVRLGADARDLLPVVIGYSALGATLAAYELWLKDDSAELSDLLDEALAELAVGFSHHGRAATD